MSRRADKPTQPLRATLPRISGWPVPPGWLTAKLSPGGSRDGFICGWEEGSAARRDGCTLSMARVVSTRQVMECNPLLCSDYPVLRGFFDLQHQMDNAAGRAGGRLGERCLQYGFALLIYTGERAVLMHATAHRLSSFQQQSGRQER